MATATLGGFADTVGAAERNAKARMLSCKVRVHFVAKSGKECNIRMSSHSLMRSMVDLDKSTNFEGALGNEISLSTFDCDLEKFKKAFSLVSREGKNPEAVVGFEINSMRTWSSKRQKTMK